ncbi:hypothetical protein DFP73DRAFT_531797 [Morchella snyderi]|nr:hypothetical protein DFP73DRAFT_531797 [Morchella snyderi]
MHLCMYFGIRSPATIEALHRYAYHRKNPTELRSFPMVLCLGSEKSRIWASKPELILRVRRRTGLAVRVAKDSQLPKRQGFCTTLLIFLPIQVKTRRALNFIRNDLKQAQQPELQYTT